MQSTIFALRVIWLCHLLRPFCLPHSGCIQYKCIKRFGRNNVTSQPCTPIRIIYSIHIALFIPYMQNTESQKDNSCYIFKGSFYVTEWSRYVIPQTRDLNNYSGLWSNVLSLYDHWCDFSIIIKCIIGRCGCNRSPQGQSLLCFTLHRFDLLFMKRWTQPYCLCRLQAAWNALGKTQFSPDCVHL